MARDDVGERRSAQIRQDDDAEVVGRDHRHLRHEAVDRAAVMDALLAAIRFDEPPQPVRRLLDLRIFGKAGKRLNHHLRPVHILHLPRRDDSFAANRAAAQVQEQPFRHVVDVGIDRASGTYRVDHPERNVGGDLFFQRVRRREVARLLRLAHGEVRVLHPKRLQDAGADDFLPGCAGNFRRQITGGEEHQVLVLELLAKILVRFEVGESRDELGARELRVVPHEIVARQARTMRHEVSRRHSLPGDVVLQREPWKVLRDRFIPLELPLFHEDSHRHGREGFGGGADGKERVRGDGLVRLHVPEPVAFRHYDLAVLDDGDGHSGHTPALHRGLHELVEPGERRRWCNGRRRCCGRGGRGCF